MPPPEKAFRVLVIDEEKDFCDFLRKMMLFHAPTLDFVTAASPSEGSILAVTLKPELIITEIFSTSWTDPEPRHYYFGRRLMEKLREKTPQSRIIICSTQADGQFGDWYVKDLGAVCYFRKPCNFEELVQKSFELLKLPYELGKN